ncbi:ROK family transcriptional regulator [Actinocorallia longicatena]|uniref:ROK family protein n=1 Tax=Actinocorallia longicatena TaxID=111803 RepID=A0ABP6QML0_9ACTN
MQSEDDCQTPVPGGGAGLLLTLLRDGRTRTLAELARLSGLPRSTVQQRLDLLVRRGWAAASGTPAVTRGRPATAYAYEPGGRIVLSAALGATHGRLAIADLGLRVLAERPVEVPIGPDPGESLERLAVIFEEMLAETGNGRGDVCGVGVGLPGPVDHATGRPANPPIMPGWDGFPVPDWLGSRFGAPVLVDNDVNVMALGEHWTMRPQAEHLIFVKIGSGIGCGIISGSALHRGAQGAAGDIGHIQVASAGEARCQCGNHGCLEAVVGGAAMAAVLRSEGVEARGGRDVVALLRAGDTRAGGLVRQAGRDVGAVMASIVNFFNPSTIVVGGDIAEAGEQLLAGLRETIYRRSLPLATQHLTIRVSTLGERAGVLGAAVMAVEHVLAPDTIDLSMAIDPAAFA